MANERLFGDIVALFDQISSVDVAKRQRFPPFLTSPPTSLISVPFTIFSYYHHTFTFISILEGFCPSLEA